MDFIRFMFEKYASDTDCDIRSFEIGVIALKKELEGFINGQLKGERKTAFAKGQDDGLRWVLDHLSFMFQNDDEQ